jgi:hypothetical protein
MGPKMSYRGSPGAPSVFQIGGFGLEIQKKWPLEGHNLIVLKKKVTKHFFIYVPAMKILSTNIFAQTHVTNPPYGQIISCSN